VRKELSVTMRQGKRSEKAGVGAALWIPTPPLFFVRVARKGHMLDAALTCGERFKVEWSKWQEEEAKSDSR
jgi:hypothetical protein